MPVLSSRHQGRTLTSDTTWNMTTERTFDRHRLEVTQLVTDSEMLGLHMHPLSGQGGGFQRMTYKMILETLRPLLPSRTAH